MNETKCGWGPFWTSTLAAAAVIFVALLGPIHQLSLGWDEGFTFDRQDRVRPWLAKLFDPRTANRSELFRREQLDRHWPFSKEEPDGHGPFYCLLSLTGWWLTHSFLAPPASYRIAPMALFAVAAGCAFTTMRRRFGSAPATVATGLLATMPRIVPEVCYALIDGPLLSLSLLAWTAFVASTDRPFWGLRIGFGVCLGLAMATKLTGWFLIAPYLLWSIWQRRRDAQITCAVGAAIACVTTLALNVGWWPDPVDGVRGFLASNLSREQTIAIPTMFWGTVYPFALPWYNTLVWTVIAVPAGALCLALFGLIRGLSSALLVLMPVAAGVLLIAWLPMAGWLKVLLAGPLAIATFRFAPRHADPFCLLLALNWALLLVVRAMPNAPGHDGTRQLLVSLGFLSVLTGYGVAQLSKPLMATQDHYTRSRWRAKLAMAVGIAVVAESAVSSLVHHPLELSYYTPAIGGLPGAARAGFEPTYFWDSVTPDVLDWINANTRPDRYVVFRNNPRSWDYLAQWGLLRARHNGPDLLIRGQWLVFQHRPGMYTEADRILLSKQPEYRKTLFGTPVLSIYRFEDFLAAKQEEADKRGLRPD